MTPAQDSLDTTDMGSLKDGEGRTLYRDRWPEERRADGWAALLVSLPSLSQTENGRSWQPESIDDKTTETNLRLQPHLHSKE